MKQKKAKMSLEKKHNLTGWAFLIPAALLILLSYDTGNYPVLYQKRIRICRAGKLPENIKG